MTALALRIPPNFFGIVFGLAGLGGAWRVAARTYGVPIAIGNAILVVAATVYLTLAFFVAVKLVRAPSQLGRELTHPVYGAFYALFAVDGEMLSAVLHSRAPLVGMTLLVVFIAIGTVYGAWISSHWFITAQRDPKFVSTAYFLPTVAMGGITADILGTLGYKEIAMGFFGIALAQWFIIGSMILYRLLLVEVLPDPLLPTLAIEIGPPVVVGNAWFGIDGERVDSFIIGLAGISIYLCLTQAMLLRRYRRLAFSPGFWSFTFPWAATAAFALRWERHSPSPAAQTLSIFALTLVSLLIAGIAVRSLQALAANRFVPANPL